MSSKKKITLIIASVVIVALLVVAALTGGASGTVVCPDCDGAGCETCEMSGEVRGTLWALLPP
ncbi:MAG: hypothetical protein KBS59_03390, partial [Clostridiales bacterium]|nr:hypothetical protein [Clostridiales bacterium]